MSLGGQARAKFLCDAERCIECNACVTACKNEHEVPWGINRRRVVTVNDGKPGERSISVACMHCSDAPCMAVCPSTVSIKQTTASCCTQKTCVSDVDIASMHARSVRHSSRKRVTLGHEARWISAHSVQAGLKKIIRLLSIKSTAATGLRKASSHHVQSNVRLRHCWLETVMTLQRFIVSAS